MAEAKNHIELTKENATAPWTGFWGERFIGVVQGLFGDLFAEAAATGVRAGMLYDLTPRPFDLSHDQPGDSLTLLGLDAGRPWYPGEDRYDSLLARIQGKWDFWTGGIVDGFDEELAAAGIGPASFVVPGSLGTPAFQAVGTLVSSTGAVSVAWPTHAAFDVGFLFVETANQAIATPSGWTAVTNGSQGVGSAGSVTGTRLQVFWRRASSNAMPNAAYTDAGDHTNAVILTVRGARRSGSPINITAGDATSDANTTAVSIPGATTTIANCLVIAAGSDQVDSAAARATSFANASLTSFNERFDAGGISGNGGGIYIATGVKATAGAYSATTATLGTTSRQGHVSIAVHPEDGTYWSRFWVDFEAGDHPITGVGVLCGSGDAICGAFNCGPEGLTLTYINTLKDIVNRYKPVQWVPWEFSFVLADTSVIHLQGHKRFDDASYVYHEA